MRSVLNKHFLVALTIGPLIVTVFFTVLMYFCGWDDAVFESIKHSQQSLYSAVASIAASLLGFTLAAVSIIMALFGQLPHEDKTEPNKKETESGSPELKRPGERVEGLNPYVEAYKKRKSKLQYIHENGHLPDVYKSFIFTSKFLAVTSMTALIGMLFEVTCPFGEIISVFLGYFILTSACSVLWCVHVLERIIKFSLRN